MSRSALACSSVKVEITNQLFLDNGYTYKPARDTVTWLQDYFRRGDSENEADVLPAPNLCLAAVQSGTYCRVNPGASGGRFPCPNKPHEF